MRCGSNDCGEVGIEKAVIENDEAPGGICVLSKVVLDLLP